MNNKLQKLVILGQFLLVFAWARYNFRLPPGGNISTYYGIITLITLVVFVILSTIFYGFSRLKRYEENKK